MYQGKPEISFIIPVCNGAAVIRRMIESIYCLTEEIAFEVIVINDGSTDETPKLLSEMEKEWANLRVISIPNSGQSFARNLGLSEAKGTYVFFADADDRVLAEGIERLYQEAVDGNYEVVCGTYYRMVEGRKPWRALEGFASGRVSRTAGKGELFRALKVESAFGYIWNKLFLRSFLLREDLCFEDSIQVYMEDQLFNLKVTGAGASFYFRNEPVYEYYLEGVSTTRKADPEIAEKSIAMLEAYDAFLCERGIRLENRDLFVPLAMRMACWAAFKNIRYEGAVYMNIKKRLELFADAGCLSFMYSDLASKEYLREIRSFSERWFFLLAFTLLKHRKPGLLAAVFCLGSPLLKKAVAVKVR